MAKRRRKGNTPESPLLKCYMYLTLSFTARYLSISSSAQLCSMLSSICGGVRYLIYICFFSLQFGRLERDMHPIRPAHILEFS